MRFSFYMPSGTPTERFAPEAFEGLTGTPVRFRLGDRIVEAELLSADVDSDGAGVTLTVELPEGVDPFAPKEG
jgi:hypothetical protein